MDVGTFIPKACTLYLLVVVFAREALWRHPEGRPHLRQHLAVERHPRGQPEVGQDAREAARAVFSQT